MIAKRYSYLPAMWQCPFYVQSRPCRASKNAAAAAACLRWQHRHPRSLCCARLACRPCKRACSADHRPFSIIDNRVAAPPERAAQSVVIVKYPALAPRVLALHDRTAKSSMSFPHDVHACAKRRTQPRRRRHDVAPALPASMQRAQNKAKLCMRMQPTAQALLCGAKHDCTMNALRTGHSQHERHGSRPNRHHADNRAGPIQSIPSAWTHLCCTC